LIPHAAYTGDPPEKELAEALLGTIFMVVGISASALSAMRVRVRARDQSLLWFGVFAAVYGLRLMSHSSLIRELMFPASAVWEQTASSRPRLPKATSSLATKSCRARLPAAPAFGPTPSPIHCSNA
jgi:hypothetical protein